VAAARKRTRRRTRSCRGESEGKVACCFLPILPILALLLLLG